MHARMQFIIKITKICNHTAHVTLLILQITPSHNLKPVNTFDHNKLDAFRIMAISFVFVLSLTRICAH